MTQPTEVRVTISSLDGEVYDSIILQTAKEDTVVSFVRGIVEWLERKFETREET